MWNFYDKLISCVDDSLTVKDFVISPDWCILVTDSGNAGLAPVYTEKWSRFKFSNDIKPGMPLSEAVKSIKAWNAHEAALGLASLNAFFNREELIPENAQIFPGGRRSRGNFMTFCEKNTKGRKAVMVEPLYDREEISSAPGMIDIVRRETSYRDYIANAYEELVPAADAVILSGLSVEDKLAAPVISKSSAKDIYMWGPDVPLAPALAEFGVKEVTGFIVDDVEKCLWSIKRAARRDEILPLGHFVTLDLR